MSSKLKIYLSLFSAFFICSLTLAQVGTNGNDRTEEGRPIAEYNLVIQKNKLTLGGVTSKGMTINGGVPGPTLKFTEGDLAIINVTNKMDVETSVHWHGIILPNFQDGVPYLTTPPIKPGTTFQYRIPINQTGTYWYHSHTMLQEQKGVYGSIIIQPREKTMDYDKELVLVFSDWTNEKSENVLRNLKRRNEWYQIKKKTAVPLSRAIARGGLGAQLKMWRDRMEGADIADVYYPTFLANGQNMAEYPDFQPGEKVRLRMINASASTYFWMDFGGGNPMMISADGIDIEPVHKSRFLFAIAETYDFIITIPDGKLEIIATAQDGSGHTAVHLGEGDLMAAEVISRPDKVAMMKDMAKMDMKMGAPSIIGNKKKNTPQMLMEKYGMHMNHSHMDMNHEGMEMNNDNMDMNEEEMEMNHNEYQMHGHEKMEMNQPQPKDSLKMQHEEMEMNHDEHQMHDHEKMEMNVEDSNNQDMHHEHEGHQMAMNHGEMQDNSEDFDFKEREKFYNYEFLKAKENTTFPADAKVNEMLLNLTGNMNRYVWSLNGIPLSEADEIKIKGGEVTRITLNNLTMMHHPMHLHGHFFRVINKNGERSPLKHTVNVPPMEKVTIEFYNEEEGDWFFHCHVLYHMMSGMTRIFSYDTPRDERMKSYSKDMIKKEDKHYFSWGTLDAGSNYNELNWVSSNIRNQFNVQIEADYDKNIEAEFTYDRYLNDWVRLYAGVNVENEIHDSIDEFNPVGLVGLKYFTPYMFNLDVSVDHQLRPRVQIDREILLFPRFFLEGEYSYRADFGIVNDLGIQDYEDETEWLVRGEYMLSRNFSLQGNYHNQFGWGGGLTLRF